MAAQGAADAGAVGCDSIGVGAGETGDGVLAGQAVAGAADAAVVLAQSVLHSAGEAGGGVAPLAVLAIAVEAQLLRSAIVEVAQVEALWAGRAVGLFGQLVEVAGEAVVGTVGALATRVQVHVLHAAGAVCAVGALQAAGQTGQADPKDK